MNYRRGLQRLYVVLVICWIAVVWLTILPGRGQPWQAKIFQTAEGTGPHFMPPEEFLAHADFYAAQTAHEEARRKWTWALLLSVVPPLMFYFVLFYVAPWIHRGFSTRTQV